MTSLVNDLLSVLGKDSTEKEFGDVARKYALDEIFDDPPFRRYVGSSKQGVDLLLENNKALDIQLYIRRTRTHSAFAGDLPLGLKRGMSQKDVHAFLGVPDSFDEFDSKYALQCVHANLTVVYDKSGVIGYISITKIAGK